MPDYPALIFGLIFRLRSLLFLTCSVRLCPGIRPLPAPCQIIDCRVTLLDIIYRIGLYLPEDCHHGLSVPQETAFWINHAGLL